MAEKNKQTIGGAEIAAIVIVVAFLALVILVFMSSLVGAFWWTIKLVILVGVLGLIIRWLLHRVSP